MLHDSPPHFHVLGPSSGAWVFVESQFLYNCLTTTIIILHVDVQVLKNGTGSTPKPSGVGGGSKAVAGSTGPTKPTHPKPASTLNKDKVTLSIEYP
jgi:hypothetical protein